MSVFGALDWEVRGSELGFGISSRFLTPPEITALQSSCHHRSSGPEDQLLQEEVFLWKDQS